MMLYACSYNIAVARDVHACQYGVATATKSWPRWCKTSQPTPTNSCESFFIAAFRFFDAHKPAFPPPT